MEIHIVTRALNHERRYQIDKIFNKPYRFPDPRKRLTSLQNYVTI